MTEEEAFIQTIAEDPEDDAPRLIYADWLTEHSDPERGEFIRVQVLKETASAFDPHWHQLAKREQELLAAHGARWRAATPVFKGVRWGALERGFLSNVSFDNLVA